MTPNYNLYLSICYGLAWTSRHNYAAYLSLENEV